LNGLPADKDPNMVRGEINPNDQTAYYPHYDPSRHPFVAPKRPYKKGKDLSVIYQKDTKPYYGPSTDYRILDTTPNEGVKVKVKMQDLSEKIASQGNINELERQLNILQTYVHGPKLIYSQDKNFSVYSRDPGAYYDPTKGDISKQISKLQHTIAQLKAKLAHPEAPSLMYGKGIGHKTVQNKYNRDREETNKYIGQNYFYKVDGVKKSNVHHRKGDINYKTVSANYDTTKEIKKTEEKRKEVPKRVVTDVKKRRKNSRK